MTNPDVFHIVEVKSINSKPINQAYEQEESSSIDNDITAIVSLILATTQIATTKVYSDKHSKQKIWVGDSASVTGGCSKDVGCQHAQVNKSVRDACEEINGGKCKQEKLK
jgi:hypothetical protein